MIIPEYVALEREKLTHFSGQLAFNYNVVVGDEYLLGFAGRQVGINFLDIIHPDYKEEFLTCCDAIDFGKEVRIVCPLIRFDGVNRLFDINVSKEYGLLGGAVFKVQAFDLISTEKRHLLFADDLRKYRSFLAMYRDYLFDYDVENDVFSLYLYLGSNSNVIYKGSIEEIRSQWDAMYPDEHDRDEMHSFIECVKSGERDFMFDGKFKLSDGDVELKKCRVNAIVINKCSGAPMVIGIIKPVDESNNVVTPYYDTIEGKEPFTGLLNKRACKEYTEFILSTNDGCPHYMIIIDVDNFKDINDAYGHLFGDRVIGKLAAIIKNSVKGRGVCGRFGGDEFYILTSKIENENELRTLLTTMRQGVRYAFEKEISGFQVTLSVGVSQYPVDGKDYDTLFKKADKSLYIAKDRGKNRFIIYDVNKHGDINDEPEMLKHAISATARAERQSLLMAKHINDIFAGGREALPDIMKKIIGEFAVDGLRVYEEKVKKPIFICGKYKVIPNVVEYFGTPTFENTFNSNNVLLINNISHFEVTLKGFCQATMVDNIMAEACFRVKREGKPTLYFFYDIFNHAVRWTEADKNSLLTLSNVVADFL